MTTLEPPKHDTLPLPFDIRKQIASHLDRPDLATLAIVCKVFQDIAESTLYARLNLCSPRNSRDPPAPSCPAINDPRAVMKLLRRSEKKARYVRCLHLTVPHDVFDLLPQRALCAVAANLEELDLRHPRGGWPAHVVTSFISDLYGEIESFPKLTKISLPIVVLQTASLERIFRVTPRLEVITLCQGVPPFVRTEEVSLIPSTLREIRLIGMIEDDLKVATNFVKSAAPTLEGLRVIPSPGYPPPLSGKECWAGLLDAVRCSALLERLEVPQGLPWWDAHGLSNLRHLTLWREYDQCYVPNLSIMEIPPLPSLEILRFLNYNRGEEHLVFYCQRALYPRSKAHAPVLIPPNLLGGLLNAPRLRTIEFHFGAYPNPRLGDVVETIKVKSVQERGRTLVWCHAFTHFVIGWRGQVMHTIGRSEQDWISLDGQRISKLAFDHWVDLQTREAIWKSKDRHLEVGAKAWEVLSGSKASGVGL